MNWTGSSRELGPVNWTGSNRELGPVSWTGSNRELGPVSWTGSNRELGPVSRTGSNRELGPVSRTLASRANKRATRGFVYDEGLAVGSHNLFGCAKETDPTALPLILPGDLTETRSQLGPQTPGGSDWARVQWAGSRAKPDISAREGGTPLSEPQRGEFGVPSALKYRAETGLSTWPNWRSDYFAIWRSTYCKMPPFK